MNPNLSLRQRLILGWLMLAMVLSPALGLMHQVVHGHGVPSPARVQVVEQVAKTHAHSQVSGTLQALFAHHTKADCLLLDQMVLGHALLAKALPVLGVLVHAQPACGPSTAHHLRSTASYSARAPPGI